MMDQEANTEKYLHDLEARLDGQNSGEERTSAVVIELRKEITRIRENEASCEEYISTLEERLAESDQDMELMQREVDRLEHVVERQRSIGKLDNLLYEFDHVKQNGKPQDLSKNAKPLTNGTSGHKNNSSDILQDAVGTAIPESDSEDLEEGYNPIPRDKGLNPISTEMGPGIEQIPNNNIVSHDHGDAVEARPSTAQSRMRSEKLDSLTQELYALRSEHETTVTEYNLMSAKYEEALRTLAELQDAADEARHPVPLPVAASPTSTRPPSFLGDARVNELRNAGQLTSSRSLSSELSLAAESNTSLEHSMDVSPQKSKSLGDLEDMSQSETLLRQENERLKQAQDEQNAAAIVLRDRYNELQELHAETLNIVEELKTEVQRTKLRSPTSPTKPLVRRKGSQNMLALDRAHRALASLKNIAAENLEDKPDTMQNFELNLNTTMQELHERAERVQVLDGELSKVKKEMEAKSTMISGLTRERSSLQSSPVDISVMSSIHEQLMQNESQVKLLRETHAAREKELLAQVESLRKSLEDQAQHNKSAMPGFFPETPALDSAQADSKQLGQSSSTAEVTKLKDEVAEWQSRHRTAIESMQASEKKFQSTIAELETAMATVDAMQSTNSETQAIARSITDRSQQSRTIDSLQRELQEHKSVINMHRDQVAELERSQVAAREQLQENARYRAFAEAQIDSHRNQMQVLKQKVLEHQSDVEFHKHGLKSLHDSHAKELEAVRIKLQSEQTADKEAQLAELAHHHEQQHEQLKANFDESMRNNNNQLADAIQKRDQLQQEQYALEKEYQILIGKLNGVEEALKTRGKELDSAKKRNKELTSALTEATSAFEEHKKLADKKSAELEKVTAERDKAARLVDELEDQLSTTYDQHRATSSRLSVLSQSHDQALQEVTSAKARLEEELEIYRNKLAQSDVRKTYLP